MPATAVVVVVVAGRSHDFSSGQTTASHLLWPHPPHKFQPKSTHGIFNEEVTQTDWICRHCLFHSLAIVLDHIGSVCKKRMAAINCHRLILS